MEFACKRRHKWTRWRSGKPPPRIGRGSRPARGCLRVSPGQWDRLARHTARLLRYSPGFIAVHQGGRVESRSASSKWNMGQGGGVGGGGGGYFCAGGPGRQCRRAWAEKIPCRRHRCAPQPRSPPKMTTFTPESAVFDSLGSLYQERRRGRWGSRPARGSPRVSTGQWD